MLLVGAGGRQRGFDLWSPDIIDEKLQSYNRLWKQDKEAVAQSPDIMETIRKVLKTLPIGRNGVKITLDKVKLGFWYMLNSTKEAAQLFNAFVAAESGDYSGLAVLAWGYDYELQKELESKYGSYHGEFFCKVVSSGLNLNRDFISETDGVNSIIGSPAVRMLWGAASQGGWPVETVSENDCRDHDINTEALILMGNLDFSAPHEYVEKELMPHLQSGHLVVLSEMGHTEMAQSQPKAFYHAAARWFYDGVVDTSLFEYNKIDFTPDSTLQDIARGIFPVEKN
jgi:hypothetical protein